MKTAEMKAAATTNRAIAGLIVRAVLALVVGVSLGIGVASLFTDERERDLAAAVADPLSALQSDRLEATLADLAVDGVSVSDDGRYLLDEEGERAVEDAVRRAEETGSAPVYVVLWAPGQELGATESDVVELMAQRLLDEPDVDRGHLLVWQGPQNGYAEPLGSRYTGYAESFGGSYDFVGEPAVALPRIVDELAAVEYVDRGTEAEDRAAARAAESVVSNDGVAVGSILLGVLLGSAVLVAAWAAGSRLRRSARPPGVWQPRGTGR